MKVNAFEYFESRICVLFNVRSVVFILIIVLAFPLQARFDWEHFTSDTHYKRVYSKSCDSKDWTSCESNDPIEQVNASYDSS